MKPQFPHFGLAGVALTVLLSACGGDSPPSAPQPRLVDSTIVVDAGDAQVINLTGRLRAVEQTVLSFEVGGEIKSLNVDVGDHAERDQVLASLVAERYQLALEQAQAAAAEAEAALKERRLDYRRQQELREQAFVSAANLDAAQAAFETAQSRLQSALTAVDIAERDVKLTRLHAPFSGSVSQRLAEPAQRVAPNEPVLELISDNEGFEVYTHVPEALVGQLEKGSLHPVQVVAQTEHGYEARIAHIGTQPASSNTYPLVLKITEPDSRLRAGMTAQINLQIDADTVQGAFLVPLTALVYDENERVWVYTIDGQKTVVPVEVSLGEARENNVVVRGELHAGQSVIARGAEFVQPGDTVATLDDGPERFN